MTIKQLSVFIENRSGRLSEVTRVLAEAGVNLRAFSMAETTEFGILRLIVSDVDLAVKTLSEAGFAARLTDVVKVSCGDEPGTLSNVLEYLSGQGIFIEYMYAFAHQESVANVVIKPNDIAACLKALESYNK